MTTLDRIQQTHDSEQKPVVDFKIKNRKWALFLNSVIRIKLFSFTSGTFDKRGRKRLIKF